MITVTDLTDRLPKLDLTKFDMPKLDMPKLDLTKFDLPKFDLPAIEVPKDVARFTDFARDAAYVSLGAVVVSVTAAEERRRGLTDQLITRVRKVVDATS